MQQPVHGRGRQRLGHQLIEASGMQIRRDRHRSAFVGRSTMHVKPLSGISADRQQAHVINDDELSTHDLGRRLAQGVVGAVGPHQHPDLLEGEPRTGIPRQ